MYLKCDPWYVKFLSYLNIPTTLVKSYILQILFGQKNLSTAADLQFGKSFGRMSLIFQANCPLCLKTSEATQTVIDRETPGDDFAAGLKHE